MNSDLFERVLIQLQPELAQEFGFAVLEDRKRLRALEIIKKKDVDIYGIKNSIDVYDYNAGIENENDFENRLLTQEEYDLLKEVLI